MFLSFDKDLSHFLFLFDMYYIDIFIAVEKGNQSSR